MSSDAELLQRYARDRDEVAFAELVRGHVDLVYSAALRRTDGDRHAAAEITQEVFLSVARHAEHLARHPVLNAWLHASTRNAAANYLRRERRHAQRQQTAHAMQTSDDSAESLAQAWATVRPEIDAALDELAEPDRQALILRFFENQSYPDLGARLGLREEAARMRVGRALEKLRARLQRRGIASTAALLGGALSANGVAGAPAGLAASVSATVATATIAAPAWGFLYFMSTTKIVATLGSIAVIAGISVFVFQRAAVPASAPVHAASLSPAPSAAAPAGSAAARPAPTVAPVVPLASTVAPSAPPAEPAAKPTGEAGKIATLRELLERLPEQSIPELKLVTEADWYVAVEGLTLDSQDEVRMALSRIRSAAVRRFTNLARPALRAYVDANGGQFPSDPVQLQPLADPKLERAMFERYRVAPADETPNVRVGSDLVLTQKNVIDSEYDSRVVIGPTGSGTYVGSNKGAGAGGGGGAPTKRPETSR